MNLHIFCATLLTVGCGIAFAMPAMAQTAAQPTAQAPSSAAAAAGKAKPAAAKDQDPRYGTRMCVRDTGSLLKPPKGQCLPVNGNSYSRKDLMRTGEMNVSSALQRLDPSVTVGH